MIDAGLRGSIWEGGVIILDLKTLRHDREDVFARH
jgi:hypothetical protein